MGPEDLRKLRDFNPLWCLVYHGDQRKFGLFHPEGLTDFGSDRVIRAISHTPRIDRQTKDELPDSTEHRGDWNHRTSTPNPAHEMIGVTLPPPIAKAPRSN